MNSDEQRELERVIDESRLQYKIVLGDASVSRCRAAMQLTRSFDGMDDETALKILELLKEKED